MAVMQWSRLSDRIGRKPVILIGLSGLCVSMTCFGLSTTFWQLAVRLVRAEPPGCGLTLFKSLYMWLIKRQCWRREEHDWRTNGFDKYSSSIRSHADRVVSWINVGVNVNLFHVHFSHV